jgi:lysozyme
MIPKAKPQRDLNWLQPLIKYAKKQPNWKNDKCILIGVRGYYRDTMGVKDKNDRRIYDDAAFWVDLETGVIASWNFNVDPNGYRKGKGFGRGKGMASLEPGLWRYKKGMHNGSKPHMGFRQAAEVTVMRDGRPDYPDTGMFGINIHSGHDSSTSSLGCQTAPASQFYDFRAYGYKLLSKYGQEKNFPYLLVELQG